MPYLAAKIPKPQYTLTISHNNNLDTLLWPIFQDFKNLAPEKLNHSLSASMLCRGLKTEMHSESILLFQTDVKALGTTENTPIFLASLTNSWSVHNWKQFLNIIYQKLVKQPFISLLYNTIKLH